ncbi:hypothetical protein BOX15_Mlig018529g2 [Macrostomum lignano]|uniref:Pyruvate carboxylase n=1 Tax=Macrostomum lignano TaxID=282301 RepID=A0A267EG09_9PLAT|nr:hypothetical protein BOX15_Mlig018529g2 [Macrostomum lignano]
MSDDESQQIDHSFHSLLESSNEKRVFKRILVANRGEIAMRIYRACSELGIRSIGVYSEVDTMHMHRTMADESYLIGKGLPPVQAYLNIPTIVQVAKETGADAVHPGYGFLSESAEFAQACNDAGIVFIGPKPETVALLGDKVKARAASVAAGVPVVPGSPGPIQSAKEVTDFCAEHGFPVILKAAFGGGGRGMRIVRRAEDLVESFERATSEAKAAFGNGSMFVERYVENARHIEIQILADSKGNVVHLHERDCSVQRRHQKVVEIAPAPYLDPAVAAAIAGDAVKLMRHVGYQNAGTVEFLYEQHTGQHFFMEVNPRIQVEHTVTEEVTGVDIVRKQIRIAEGYTLAQQDISQESIKVHGFAMQCRITTEDPHRGFQPDSGRLEDFRPGLGIGIRLDSASAYAGAIISPYYDSLLCKVIVKASNFHDCVVKTYRCLGEFRIRGVKTNIPFLRNLLNCSEFLSGPVSTGFLDRNPQLVKQKTSKNKAQRLLFFIAETLVNGSTTPISNKDIRIPEVNPPVPDIDYSSSCPPGWRQILLKEGPEAFAKAILRHPTVLLTDTTMRDAHQSLLATRVRTHDLIKIAPFVARRMENLLSLECWGGATFDVAMRFLHECPWDRLEELRKRIPNIPFQMLLRGANAVGYTNYPDNVVYKFCEEAVKSGMDIFRVFDCLNYVPNMLVGMDAVRKAGGVVEAALCYTGDVTRSEKYTLQYYLDTAEQLVRAGTHILAIKDMAGLLKPDGARLLVRALKTKFPDYPLHVHTHDTAGAGVATLLACAEAGADIIDAAVDSMSGITSQPSMGALVASLGGNGGGLRMPDVTQYSSYWELTRRLYANFECTSTMRSGNADVYENQIPGGQYTNLQFQSMSLGLADQFELVKKRFSEANQLLGDIIKVTPSSKIVGDLAQFMVQNGLSYNDVLERASDLSFPTSVIEFFDGHVGQPYGGFPPKLAAAVLRGRPPTYTDRPGAKMPPFDFDALRERLNEKFSDLHITEKDLISSALYPRMHEQFMINRRLYGPVWLLDTRVFFQGPKTAEELEIQLHQGKTMYVKPLAVAGVDKRGQRECFFEVNGQQRVVYVTDREASKDIIIRPKADQNNKGSVGSPMPGEILAIKVKQGDAVEKGQALIVVSAMKMELVVSAPITGKVKSVYVTVKDKVEGNDLVMDLE